MLSLHVLQGPDRGKRFQLPDNEPQLIGRSSESLPITDRSVSRRHAELTPGGTSGREWYLRDIDSSNGTFLNGERIHERVKLLPGDQIRCGSTLLVFAIVAEEVRSSPLRVLGPEEMDATVEATSRPFGSMGEVAGDDRLTLHSPDPSQAAVQHLRIVYELTALTSRSLDREELLNRVMDLIFEEFSPDRGFILLQDDPSQRPDPVVIRYKQRPKTQDEGHIPVSRTIVQHVLRKMEGILSSNAMSDTRFRSGDSVMRYGIRSAICVPIKTGDRIFGVIHVDSSVADAAFTQEQLRLLTVVGMHAGLALTTAELIRGRLAHERLAVMGETVASLSHSIKNILQGLRGGADAVELALNRGNLDHAKEGWPIIARNLDRIFALTMNMLAYSKKRQPELELQNPHAVIADALELVQPQCVRKRVALLRDFDEAMPPVPLDAGAIHQALMNLLTNAIEAVAEKKGMITIRTRFDASRHVAEIHVADNGPGVSAEIRSAMFTPFQSTKGQRGTGLGLAVARKIAREHGGDVILLTDDAARPSRSPGAIFVLTLPAGDASTDSSETRAPRAEGGMGDWASA